MTSRDFCYWLMGYFEISENQNLDQREIDIITKHLDLVFKHEIDPSMGEAEHQTVLNAIHHKPGDMVMRC